MIRTETGDGASLAGRPELGTILEFIHPGETLVVTRIDRLARSMRDLQVIVATLKDKDAHLAATEQPVDTSTAAGKAFFDMLGVFAEFETNLRRERQAEGIAAAKQRGAYRGRPPGSTWKPSGIGWPWACRRRKSLASWGSRAEPSTRPGRAARDKGRLPAACSFLPLFQIREHGYDVLAAATTRKPTGCSTKGAQDYSNTCHSFPSLEAVRRHRSRICFVWEAVSSLPRAIAPISPVTRPAPAPISAWSPILTSAPAISNICPNWTAPAAPATVDWAVPVSVFSCASCAAVICRLRAACRQMGSTCWYFASCPGSI